MWRSWGGREKLEETVRRITQAGGEAIAVMGDIAKYSDMEAAVAEAVKRWGRLDVVFANAGINGVWTPIEELAPQEWGRRRFARYLARCLSCR